ncbi:MAG: asparagine synthase (glutamine-hydrolyzing) [Candidatus Riflebacteria bacterium]|nr:asparagine synthase (glutamine-hydrolyzing) [Candidatus Riflebacteria bacterium]
MCGIAGIWFFKEGANSEPIEKMARALSHRGPDGLGTAELIKSQLFFAHTRLAIIDLSERGAQPLFDKTNENCITFNGEIYNYQQLRRTLTNEGYEFESDTDTEVILKAYDCWGEECTGHLRGIFAFAIWNSKKREVFVARDHMGVKPLYFYSDSELFIFGSEVRAILSSNLVKKKLSSEGLVSYLSYGSVQEPFTMVDKVNSLPPACSMTIFQSSKTTKKTYWSMFPLKTLEKSLCESYEEIKNILLESTKLQLIADVPLGAFLSGGIDSSAIVSLMRASGKENIKTFNLVFPGSIYDESSFAQKIAKKFHTEHHELELTSSTFVKFADKAIADFDQPSMDGLNTWFVAKLTREAGLKVALSGAGGDELFAGYNCFSKARKIRQFAPFLQKLPGFIGIMGEALAPKVIIRKAFEAINFAFDPYFLARNLFSEKQIENMLDPQLLKIGRNWFPQAYSELTSNVKNLDEVNAISILEMQTYLLSTLLRDTDQMSMAHALEVRVPLLDHLLVESVMKIHGDLKIIPPHKSLLVNAVGNLPPHCYERPKQGFVMPFEDWLQKAFSEEMLSFFTTSTQSIFPGKSLKKIWQDFSHGRTDWTRVWSLFVLSKWMKKNDI